MCYSNMKGLYERTQSLTKSLHCLRGDDRADEIQLTSDTMLIVTQRFSKKKKKRKEGHVRTSGVKSSCVT